MGVIVPSFRQEGISSSDRIRLKILYSHFIRIWPPYFVFRSNVVRASCFTGFQPLYCRIDLLDADFSM